MNKLNIESFKDYLNNATEEVAAEQLERYGSDTLNDTQLLSLFFHDNEDLKASEMAEVCIKHFGSLHKMSRLEWQEFTAIPGVGKTKAMELKSLFEISRRLHIPETNEEIFIKCPDDFNDHFGPKLRDLRNEHFLIVFLNAAKKVTGYKNISIGGKTATIVEPAEVMKQAILHDAHSIIISHNHPSGNTKASMADIQLTKRLVAAGKMLGISVEDHIIIAGYDFTSLRSQGIMN